MKNKMKEKEILPRAIKEGVIEAEHISIECYKLDDGTRVISTRGIQRALGMVEKTSGTRISGDLLKRLLLTRKNKEFSVAQYNLISGDFKSKFVKFTTTKNSTAHGFEATFLMDVCHYIQDLNTKGRISQTYQYLFTNATIVYFITLNYDITKNFV